MLSSLIASLVSGEASEAVARARRAAIVYALAAILLACGLGFLLIAGFVVAAREFGVVPAALGFGAGFIVVALLLVAIHGAVAKARAKRVRKRRQSDMAAVASAAAVAMLPALLADRRGRSIAMLAPAAALGWAIWRENARKSRDADSPD